ncbi:MAG: OmpA family protein [Janthinobacterium lividum]
MRVQAQAIRLSAVALAGLLAACAAPSTGPATINGAANTGPAASAAPSKPTVGQEIAAVADNKITVTFPQGGATLTPDANKQLDLAARLYRDANPVAMFTAGYTDRSGDEFGNLLLSAERARAVKGGLVARGIPADRLLIQAFGSSELANSSDPQAAENRRVVVTWRLL